MNFLLAGRDTTATALSWTLYLLAQHPNVEQIMVDEIDAAYMAEGIAAGSEPSSLTYETLKILKYTQVFYQRLYGYIYFS
jgi:cytochrome P450